jgi:hypothetical protein
MQANRFADRPRGPQPCGDVPQLARRAGKFVLDILPAALASVIGGFLLTQYQFGRTTSPQPALQQITPASAEVLALVRDEHDAISGYLQSQLSAEKSRLAAEDAENARAVADAKVAKAADAEAAQEADAEAVQEKQAPQQAAELNSAEIKLPAAAPTRHNSPTIAQAKVAVPRTKPAAVATSSPREPLLIAQAEQNTQASDASAPPADRLARDPDSLLAKTLDLKDQVVAATRHAVSAIGDMFSSVGDHINGAAPSAPQFSSDS